MANTPYVHVGRKPEIICLRDRDFIAFVTDTVGCFSYASEDDDECTDRTPTDDETMSLSMKADDDGVWQYQATVAEYPKKGDRVVMWYRLSQEGVITAPPRFLYYIDENDPDGSGALAKLLPFREVISPSFSYDSDSNTLSMFFWTNYSEFIGVGDVIDPTKVIRLNEGEFDLTKDEYKHCYRVFCVARGNIFHMNAQGGYAARFEFYGGAAPDTQKNPDMIPLFQRPVCVDTLTLDQVSDGLVPIVDFVPLGGAGSTPAMFRSELQTVTCPKAEIEGEPVDIPPDEGVNVVDSLCIGGDGRWLRITAVDGEGERISEYIPSFSLAFDVADPSGSTLTFSPVGTGCEINYLQTHWYAWLDDVNAWIAAYTAWLATNRVEPEPEPPMLNGVDANEHGEALLIMLLSRTSPPDVADVINAHQAYVDGVRVDAFLNLYELWRADSWLFFESAYDVWVIAWNAWYAGGQVGPEPAMPDLPESRPANNDEVEDCSDPDVEDLVDELGVFDTDYAAFQSAITSWDHASAPPTCPDAPSLATPYVAPPDYDLEPDPGLDHSGGGTWLMGQWLGIVHVSGPTTSGAGFLTLTAADCETSTELNPSLGYSWSVVKWVLCDACGYNPGWYCVYNDDTGEWEPQYSTTKPIEASMGPFETSQEVLDAGCDCYETIAGLGTVYTMYELDLTCTKSAFNVVYSGPFYTYIEQDVKLTLKLKQIGTKVVMYDVDLAYGIPTRDSIYDPFVYIPTSYKGSYNIEHADVCDIYNNIEIGKARIAISENIEPTGYPVPHSCGPENLPYRFTINFLWYLWPTFAFNNETGEILGAWSANGNGGTCWYNVIIPGTSGTLKRTQIFCPSFEVPEGSYVLTTWTTYYDCNLGWSTITLVTATTTTDPDYDTGWEVDPYSPNSYTRTWASSCMPDYPDVTPTCYYLWEVMYSCTSSSGGVWGEISGYVTEFGPEQPWSVYPWSLCEFYCSCVTTSSTPPSLPGEPDCSDCPL